MCEYLKIYGERNTCTNYLAQLANEHIQVKQLAGTGPRTLEKLRYRKRWITSGQYERLNDAYFQATFRWNLGWKHTCVPPAAKLSRYRLARDGRTAFVTIVKNPYAWLLSLFRKPYHQYFERSLTLEEFLQRPWSLMRRDGVAAASLDSPVQLWNVKAASYNQLAQALPTVQLRSEDVQTDPQRAIERVADELKLTLKGPVTVENSASTKKGGRDSAWYRDYYDNEKWRDELSAAAIDVVNQTVDRNLMNQYGYGVL